MAGLADFESIKEYYPGSRHPIVTGPQTAERVNDPAKWDARPRVLKIGGVEREFFTIGHLAKALNRKPVTIRGWERDGVIPKSTFRKPSEDPRGTRRLYTRAQVEGILRIADEEGLMRGDYRPISDTDFTRRVIALFRELAAAES